MNLSHVLNNSNGKWFLSLIAIMAFWYGSMAQLYPFQEIGLEQGMPNNRINDFIQDSRGFYWLATEGTGLVRYDGYEFKTYRQTSIPSRLFVSCLAEDRHGIIWAGLENSILSFDGLRFNQYDLPEKTERVRDIIAVGSGSILVLSNKGVIWEFLNEQWELYNSNIELRINEFALVEENLWVSTDDGLYQMNKKRIEKIDDGKATALNYFENKVKVSYPEYTSSYNTSGKILSTDSTRYRYLFTNAERELAISNTRDLIIFSEDVTKRLSSANGLPNNEYKGCYADDAGVIWLYSNNGLVKLESLAWKFYRNFPVGSPPVSTVYKDKEGNIFGGLNNGLVRINPNGLLEAGYNNEFPFGITLGLEEHQGSLWAGTERGLIKQTKTGIQSIINESGFVFALKAMDDLLYLGSERGLLVYENNSFRNVSTENGLFPPSVYGFSQGTDGSIWVGTYLQGFYRQVNGNWEVVTELNGKRVDSTVLSCFAAVSESEIWAGTLSDGIYHFSNKGMQHISTAQLNFAEIQSMTIDDEGTVWAGTNKGLIEIKDGNISDIIELSQGSGFQGSSCMPQAIMIRDNELLAGTMDGLQVLDLENYQKKRPAPKLALTDIKMFLEQNDILKEYASDSLAFSLLPSKVELPNNLNFLSFNMAALTGYQKDKLRYRYRLVGQSDEWTYAGSRREAIFSNIKPGKYTFQAEVSRFGEEWSEYKLSYSFNILRPIYLRWWFLALLILFTGTLIFLFVKDRVKRLNQRLRLENDLLEMERKALRLQMNPHFIFNALDSISSFIFKKDPEKAVRYLNNFAKLMRLTLESSMEHLHPVETEVSILKNYLELEKLRFQGKFDYHFEIDEEIDYDIGIPPMLIQPHVENAILHGIKPKKDPGKLDIRFILDDDLLIIEVEDDGIGRRKSREMKKRKDHRSMATQINRDRLRLLKLSMSEKVAITISDKEEKGEPTGTKVIIKLPAEEI